MSQTTSQTRAFLAAVYRLYEHSGFAMPLRWRSRSSCRCSRSASSSARSPVSWAGGELAAKAVSMLFEILPAAVAQALVPQVEQILGQSRIDLLTFGGFLALFFATSAVETLRAALNGAYRVVETRSYPACLGLSMLLVFFSAVSMLVLAWAVVVGAGAGRSARAAYHADIPRQLMAWPSGTLCHRRRDDRSPAVCISPLARSRQTQCFRRVARRRRNGRALARDRRLLLGVSGPQQLHALLRRAFRNS